MQKEQHNLKELFQKLFSGTASRKEKEQVSGWLSQLDVSERELTFEDIERQRLQFQKNFHERYVITVPDKKIIMLHVWLSTVAAAILLLVAGAIFIHPQRQKQEALLEAKTRAGERKIITLSDGTTISLNNTSNIRFPNNFTGSTREVYLTGEAFFVVVHNEEKPFIVNTGKMRVQVLGTSFDVRNYIADDNIDVTVATGKVGVIPDKEKRSHLLTPGQQLSYNRKTGKISEVEVNPSDYTGWQQGDLIFKNEPLSAICKRLERWYDVKITIKNEALKTRKISIEQKDESLQNVLKMLGIAGDLKFEISGNNVEIW